MTLLRAQGRANVGSLALEVDLTVDAGEVVAIVGPNGSGKSSTLAAVLGLLPMEGRVEVHGHDVSERPLEARGLGWCPQAPGLPPTARVERLLRRASERAERGDGASARARMVAALELGQMPARVSALSGGQAQRVALGRALLASDVVLADEPVAAQDAHGAALVRGAIRAHAAAGGGVLLVSHRPDDLDGLADRVVVLDGGQVRQHGTLAEVRAAPTTAHAARVLGTTVLVGEVDDAHVLRGGWGELRVGDGAPVGQATALIRPSAVALATRPPSDGSQRNVLEMTVASVTRHLDGVTVSLDGRPALRALVTHDAAEALGLQPGQPLWASIKAADVTVLPAGA